MMKTIGTDLGEDISRVKGGMRYNKGRKHRGI